MGGSLHQRDNEVTINIEMYAEAGTREHIYQARRCMLLTMM
jgi:hypothetical protein